MMKLDTELCKINQKHKLESLEFSRKEPHAKAVSLHASELQNLFKTKEDRNLIEGRTL